MKTVAYQKKDGYSRALCVIHSHLEQYFIHK